MCGIAGYFCRSGKGAAGQAMFALYSQQHRGQESCGIASTDGARIGLRKGMGYVKEVFSAKQLEEMAGFAAIGHVRYPTRGSCSVEMAQPHIIETLSGPIYAIASNGDIVNYDELVLDLQKKGVHFHSRNDGELLGRFIVYYHEREGYKITEAIRLMMKKVKGAYSAVFLTRNHLYIFRDFHGFRPLLFGRVGEDYAVASESVALDILHAKDVREVKPGEIIVITPNTCYQLDSGNILFDDPKKTQHTRHCIFELIYFSRPDSFEFNEYVYNVRNKLGAQLAKYDEFQADVVVPVPDSANFIAMGYAREKGIPYQTALIRNHYVGRTFIRPDQYSRDESVRQKFNPLKDFFNGKIVVLVDDSVVRGTTIRKLVRMVKSAGAREVHLRIGSPPVKYSCYYGIDTPDRGKLIANKMTLQEITEYIGADSLKYLDIKELGKCVKKPENFCYACFNGDYPVPPAESVVFSEKIDYVENRPAEV